MSGRWVRRAAQRTEEAARGEVRAPSRAEQRGARLTAGPTGIVRAIDEVARPLSARELRGVYKALLATYGAQQWWPTAASEGAASGGTGQRLEICLGAILTQNTSWRGAAAALANLRAADALSCEAIVTLPEDALGDLVRPSGHFRVKARKLQSFCGAVIEQYGGDLDALLGVSGSEGSLDEVRGRLLAIWGVGPETADAMTLYAARLPTFVVDAYAYRLFERLGRTPGPRKYDVYRDYFMQALGDDVRALNEWHALIVRHGQRTCRKTAPRCGDCALLDRCPYGRAQVGAEGARGAGARA